jgi:hypothetical protein
MTDGISLYTPSSVVSTGARSLCYFYGRSILEYKNGFSKALVMLDKDYSKYRKAVEAFRNKISWQNIAAKHAQLYNEIANKKASILTTVQAGR